MKKGGIYYAGFWGGKKQIAPLGALLIIVCGIPLLVAFFLRNSISPDWLAWSLEGGILLGVLLLLSGLFAVDANKKG